MFAKLTATLTLLLITSCQEADDSEPVSEEPLSGPSAALATEQKSLPAITPGSNMKRVQTTLDLIGAEDISEYIGYRSAQLFDLGESPTKNSPITETRYYELKNGAIYRLNFRLKPSPCILQNIAKADSASMLAKKQETWREVKMITIPNQPSP